MTREKNKEPATLKKRMLTLRDIMIVNFINEFGFCEMSSIQKRFNLKMARSYQIMARLVEMDVIKHERVFHNKPGFYWVTKTGARFTPLNALETLPIGNHTHQLTIIEVYLKLRTLLPTSQWVSERKLEHDKFSKGLGQRGHLSDGILLLADGTRIAIEVELSMKGENRLNTILKEYGAQFGFEEIWYYCDISFIKTFQRRVEKLPYIKVFNLQEFLA